MCSAQDSIQTPDISGQIVYVSWHTLCLPIPVYCYNLLSTPANMQPVFTSIFILSGCSDLSKLTVRPACVETLWSPPASVPQATKLMESYIEF